MLRRISRAHLTGRPIFKEEFLASVSDVFPALVEDGRQKLGLAISGGVDSMALALMCHHYLPNLPRRGNTLQAFIIDHGLRPGSAEEAKSTRARLQEIGIPTIVVTPRWKVSKVSKVETSARGLRYQALYMACHQHNIRHMFTAHHSDDQVETVLYRLSQGARDRVAMAPSATMPEGNEVELSPSILKRTAIWSRVPSPGCHGISSVFDLDVKLSRPLLRFSKCRLKATCEHFGLAWTEDATNADPTYTSRNAIRYMRSRWNLPKALGADALERLADVSIKRQQAALEARDQLFARSQLELDLRTDSLILSPPPFENLLPYKQELGSFHPNLSPSDRPGADSRSSIELTAFAKYLDLCTANFWTKQEAKAVLECFKDLPVGAARNVSNMRLEHLPGGRWRFSKEPTQFPVGLKTKGHRSVEVRFDPANEWSQYKKFGNWWIRVWNPSSAPLILRYVQPRHINRLLAKNEGRRTRVAHVHDRRETPRSLLLVLGTLGTSYMRYKLPVLVRRSTAFAKQLELLCKQSPVKARRAYLNLQDPDSEQAVAFPTLNLRVCGPDAPPELQGLKWEVHYRGKPIPGKELEDIVTVPTNLASQGFKHSVAKKPTAGMLYLTERAVRQELIMQEMPEVPDWLKFPEIQDWMERESDLMEILMPGDKFETPPWDLPDTFAISTWNPPVPLGESWPDSLDSSAATKWDPPVEFGLEPLSQEEARQLDEFQTAHVLWKFRLRAELEALVPPIPGEAGPEIDDGDDWDDSSEIVTASFGCIEDVEQRDRGQDEPGPGQWRPAGTRSDADVEGERDRRGGVDGWD